MSIEPDLARCFGPEERNHGERLFAADAVHLASAGDSNVRANLKAPSAPRVTLTADDVTSPDFRAQCTCPRGKKGALCKHIWATLLALEIRDAEFLTGRTEAVVAPRETSTPHDDRRRERLEQQKARARDMRRARKAQSTTAALPPRTQYPEVVTEALEYFRQNGFELATDLDWDHVNEAKRSLARVFHPDRGGTHDEAITLNLHFETLSDYLNA